LKRLALWTMIMACFVMLFSPLQAFAASSKVQVVVDDEVLKLDVAPYIKDNRVLVPVRSVFEELGLLVKWKQSTKTATITDGVTTIEMKLGQKTVKVNGKATKIDTAVSIKDNRVFIPLRFVTENTDGDVKWNQAKKTVYISTSALDKETKEFLSKVAQAQVEMNSFSANMKIKQAMDIGGEKITTDMVIDMDAVLDPIGIYQSMKMAMEGPEGEELSTQSYMTKDGYYVYESNQWIKYDEEMLGDLEDLTQNQLDPNVQIELMEKFYKGVKIVENDKTYELRMSVSGNGFQELLDEILNLSDLGLEEDILAGIDMKIDKMYIVTVLDKETLYPLSGTMDSDITIGIEGEKMSISQQAEYTYSNINKLSEIKIPQEVIDSAVPFEEVYGDLETGL
jgi:hypothetical protein